MTPAELARAAQLNAQIKIEINSFPVNIDKTIFKKTMIEKIALKKAKILSKIENKTLRNSFIATILDHPSPNFESLKLDLL